MHKKNIKNIIINIALPIIFFIGIFLLVEILVIFLNIPEYLLPRPTLIVQEIFKDFIFLLRHMAITMTEAIVGYIIGNGLGFIFAIVFAHSKAAEKGLYPYAIALKTTPIIAIAPFIVLWFGTGIFSKIIIAAVICFFPILVNTLRGLKSVTEEELDLFKSFFASRRQIFLKLRIPVALPYIFSALKISTGLAVIGAVVGEFVGSNQGIGYITLVSSYHFETAKMFAAVIMSSLGGILFFGLISIIEKKVIFWKKSEEVY